MRVALGLCLFSYLFANAHGRIDSLSLVSDQTINTTEIVHLTELHAVVNLNSSLLGRQMDLLYLFR